MSSRLTPRTEFYKRFYDFSYRHGGYSYTTPGNEGNPAFKAIDSHHIDVKGDHKTPNPFGFYIYQYRPVKGEAVYHSGSYGAPVGESRYSGEGMVEIEAHLCDEGDLVSRVTSRCLTKIIGQIKNSDLNLATTVGEGRETIALLESISSSATKCFAHISSAASSRDWRRRVKLLGGAVLFYNLALKPLLSDIDALRKHVLSTDRMRQRRKLDERSGKSETFKQDISSSADGMSLRHVEELEFSARCRIVCWVEVTDLHQFESWRAGLLVRPSLAWELTTLSFLVDYFYDVGRMLEQYESTVMYNGFTVSEVATTVTTRSKRSVKTSAYRTDRGEFSGYRLMDRQNDYSIESKSLERTIGPLPSVSPPFIKVPRSSTQLLNIAGLLTNLFKLSNRG